MTNHIGSRQKEISAAALALLAIFDVK